MAVDAAAAQKYCANKTADAAAGAHNYTRISCANNTTNEAATQIISYASKTAEAATGADST